MELSEQDISTLVAMITGTVWSSGDFRSFTSSELQQAVKDGVERGFDRIKEDKKPLYSFTFHRLLVPVGDGEDLNDEDVKKAEKKRSYMKVIAEDEPAALHEAGRISAASGSEHMWLFVPETITPALLPNPIY